MEIQDYKWLMQAVGQAAIEADIMLNRFKQLDKYTITVRTETGGFNVSIDRNHQVSVSNCES